MWIHIKTDSLNLINNAKYTKEAVRLILKSVKMKKKRSYSRGKRHRNRNQRRKFVRLFDAFMRVDSKENKKIKGTGIRTLQSQNSWQNRWTVAIWAEKCIRQRKQFFVQLPMKKVSDGKIS